jgi:hypothetical protein
MNKKELMRYTVQDWAGNRIFINETFATFEDADEAIWDLIRSEHDDDESFRQEYFAVKETI